MKKAVYVLAFLASFLISSGVISKFMHWPGASALLVSGFAFLNLGFLPVFFYQKFKTAA